MIKKPACTLNIRTIYMHISNVCVCNKYLLNEYNVCTQTYMKQREHVHLIWQIFVAHLVNINLYWRLMEDTQSFLFPRSFSGVGETRPQYFWQWFSKCDVWPSDVGGGLVWNADFCHPAVGLLSQNTVDGRPAIYVSKALLGSLIQFKENVRTTGLPESFNVLMVS